MLPQQHEHADWLTPDTFATQADLETHSERLEQRFAQSCSLDNARGEAQLAAINTSLDVLHRIHSEVRAFNRERAVPQECPPRANDRIGNKEILGEVEWIGLPSLGTALKARVDTGATSSSLTAHEITRFERDGENWVRFKLALTEDDEVAEHLHGIWLEAPIVRTARIIQASGSDNRPVIRLPMKLGNIEQTAEFTLSDRTQLTYPVLLGRRFLMDMAVVDVSQRYLHSRPRYPDDVMPAIAARDQNGAHDEEETNESDDADNALPDNDSTQD